MVTKELLKNEIDGISDEYLDMLYNIIKAFRLPTKENKNPMKKLDELVSDEALPLSSEELEQIIHESRS